VRFAELILTGKPGIFPEKIQALLPDKGFFPSNRWLGIGFFHKRLSMRKVLSSVFTVIVIGYVIYSWIPKYHEFTKGTEEIAPGEVSYIEIDSTSSSAIKVVLSEKKGRAYDAYLVSDLEMTKLMQWLQTGDPNQPNVSFFAKWENKGSMEDKDIIMPKGKYFLLIDNTLLGGDYGVESNITVDYALFEKR
jgi:hypothetical protein